MSLFEVKGWEIPSKAVVASAPRRPGKRKRPARDTGDVQAAEVNLEKLMRKLEKGGFESTEVSKKKKRKEKEERNTEPEPSTNGKATQPGKASKKRKTGGSEAIGTQGKTSVNASKYPSKRIQKVKLPESSTEHSQPSTRHIPARSPPKKKSTAEATVPHGLTPLQSTMKGSLDGARFRWINEMLYTTGSGEGHKLMREDPMLYEEYHKGFRQQVRSWPSNPISHYLRELSSYPRGTVIADLGCGDAALARGLIQNGYCVLSFDLVADGVFVLEADVCEKIPLPGSEESKTDGNQGQIVDVCVCALSLMSLDWIQCIRETWRILRVEGELKIAEVTSRFTDVDQFVSIIERIGFRLKSKDETNTHFTLFDFQKVAREPLTERDWEGLEMKHNVLKPCEYKRR